MHVISASRRMDLPAFQLPAFLEAARRGWLDVLHPFTGQRERIDLTGPDVAGIVFWTRRPAALLPHLEELQRLWPGRIRVQTTLTGMPGELEPRAPGAEETIAALRQLARRLGPDALTWRLDPLLLSDVTPPAWWERTFAGMAAKLEGQLREVTLSWLDLTPRARRNLLPLERQGICLSSPTAGERRELLDRLAAVAANHGLPLTACCEPEMLEHPAISRAACLDPEWFETANGLLPGALGHAPSRPGCGCARAKDVGVYNSCAFGCRYCYANARPRMEAPADPWTDSAAAP